VQHRQVAGGVARAQASLQAATRINRTDYLPTDSGFLYVTLGPSSRGPDRYRLSGGGRRGARARPKLLTPSDTSVLYSER
jgi:hypothetical protein